MKGPILQKISMGCNVYHHWFIWRFEKNCIYRESCWLAELASRGVVFWLRISLRIRSQNRNGAKRCVRDLCRTGLCKIPRKSASLPCPFKYFIVKKFKGTVWPDWIYMRVVSWYHWMVPLKRTSTAIDFRFFNFDLEYLKRLRVLSRFMQKWIQPPACSDHGLHRILSSYWLAHFIWEKKSAKVQLNFGLDCGMLEFFSHEGNPKNN